MASQRVEVPGSQRDPEPQSIRVADADGGEQTEVTVYLRPAAPLDWVDAEASQLPVQRRMMSREQLATVHGAADADVASVRQFALQSGLEVGPIDKARRSIVLQGTVDAMTAAFDAQGLGVYQRSSGPRYRARSGVLTVPAELDGVIVGVFGIDVRPQAMPRLRRHAQAGATASYTPRQVAEAYDFPLTLDGSGETVAIVELGGGYSESDLSTYFSGMGLPTPSVSFMGVDGGANSPGTDQDADGEVMLDIEVIGSIAPAASIVMYFAPNTDQGFMDAVSTAVHDTTNNPSVVSISWGGPEDSWTSQARSQMEQIMIEAAALGVTVTVAAGDGGSTDGVSDGKQHVDFPASAPHALACGGTSLTMSDGRISSETVWNDGPLGGAGGGGISIEFAVPAYQSALTMPTNVDTGKDGRGVPDVAGDADPRTGYTIRVDGAEQTVGGTSAVAPLWAGLTALINQSLGISAGFLQPLLYAASAGAGLHDITKGNNGSYRAVPGWDPCTGLGSPSGTALLQALGGTVPAATTP